MPALLVARHDGSVRFFRRACENLLSEVNCALMFRDGDLMAVPLHPALRGLPPALARDYFQQGEPACGSREQPESSFIDDQAARLFRPT